MIRKILSRGLRSPSASAIRIPSVRSAVIAQKRLSRPPQRIDKATGGFIDPALRLGLRLLLRLQRLLGLAACLLGLAACRFGLAACRFGLLLRFLRLTSCLGVGPGLGDAGGVADGMRVAPVTQDIDQFSDSGGEIQARANARVDPLGVGPRRPRRKRRTAVLRCCPG